ncbi:MAG: hypothetical protein AB7U73_16275 [Pirellulales bacterium]
MPRLAVGTVQPQADSQVITWALMQALRQCGRDIQHFAGRAVLPRTDGATPITGVASRYLDSWVMSPEVCQSLFLRAAGQCDLAVVEGAFVPCGAGQQAAGGQLDTLCHWLGLPRLAVIDVQRLSPCLLPTAPAGIEGVLLDRIADEAQLARWQTTFESFWGVPVLGALDSCAEARWQIAQLPPGSRPLTNVCEALGERFLARSKLARILALAERPFSPCGSIEAYCRCHAHGRLRVGVAYDPAFQGYFADTLELLEQGGAEVVAFSPLADETLPEDIDLVYLGDAQLEPYAAALAENQCMLLAIRSWVCCGGAVYAEGGGLAYLCDRVEMADGVTHALAGALPAEARHYPSRNVAEPCELVLPRDTWLGEAGARLRGYRDANWQILLSPQPGVTAHPEESPCLVLRRGLIGSLAQIDFAAQPALMSRFFCPARAGLRFSPSQVVL